MFINACHLLLALAEGGCLLSRFHFTRCRYFLGHVACPNLPWQGLVAITGAWHPKEDHEKIPIGEFLLRSSFTFYDLTHRIRGRIYEPKLMQKFTELIKLSSLYNFQLFASNTDGNISHQKPRNCCVAKKLMSHAFFVKFHVFRREFLRKY